MPWEYSDKVLELFRAAVQGEAGSHMGELDDPDGFGEYGSIACGDTLRFTFRVRRHPTDPRRDVITEARYLTFGCTSAIAASEALCRLLEEQGRTPIEALQVTNRDLVDFLGGLPEQKIHCSVMGAEALQRAVADWARKRHLTTDGKLVNLVEETAQEGRVVCHCFSLTEPYLKRKIRELGLHSISEISNALKAGGACGQCQDAPGGLQDLLHEVWGTSSGDAAGRTHAGLASPVGDELSPYRRGQQIEKAIRETISPLLQQEGGDIELVDIKGYKVYCRLGGRCTTCQNAPDTVKLLVEQQLKELIDDRLQVIAV